MTNQRLIKLQWMVLLIMSKVITKLDKLKKKGLSEIEMYGEVLGVVIKESKIKPTYLPRYIFDERRGIILENVESIGTIAPIDLVRVKRNFGDKSSFYARTQAASSLDSSLRVRDSKIRESDTLIELANIINNISNDIKLSNNKSTIKKLKSRKKSFMSSFKAAQQRVRLTILLEDWHKKEKIPLRPPRQQNALSRGEKFKRNMAMQKGKKKR